MNRWVDRHFFLVICAIGAGLAATLIKRALATPFWHDEIFTILASGLPPTTLWAASRDGLDLAPPFNTVGPELPVSFLVEHRKHDGCREHRPDDGMPAKPAVESRLPFAQNQHPADRIGEGAEEDAE